jgi:hypothetical protein
MSFSKNGIGGQFLDVLNNIHQNFYYCNAPTKYLKVHCVNSDLLVSSIHEEKSPPDFSPNPTLELLFAKNACANRSKNASSLPDRASNNKNKIVVHPTDHGNARFGPTQQPTNNIAARV